jgi:hypothetical protein
MNKARGCREFGSNAFCARTGISNILSEQHFGFGGFLDIEPDFLRPVRAPVVGLSVDTRSLPSPSERAQWDDVACRRR